MTTITSRDRTARYSELANTLVSAANGVDYAYRDTGPGNGVPLVLLQNFRGNLDNWDPALIDALAADRRVVTFDYAGVGGSTGQTAHTAEQMAHESIAFIEALDATAGVKQIDHLIHLVVGKAGQQVGPERRHPRRHRIGGGKARIGQLQGHGAPIIPATAALD